MGSGSGDSAGVSVGRSIRVSVGMCVGEKVGGDASVARRGEGVASGCSVGESGALPQPISSPVTVSTNTRSSRAGRLRRFRFLCATAPDAISSLDSNEARVCHNIREFSSSPPSRQKLPYAGGMDTLPLTP